jgi:hypothetical protein
MFKVDFNIQSMKILRAISFLLVIVGLSTYMGCDGGGSPAPPVEDVQFDKLAKTWNVTTVSFDGAQLDLTASGYTNFKLVLGGTKGTPPFSYTTTGRPSVSPWPASGTWEFGSDVQSQIIRYNTIDDDELAISYTVTESTLTLTFSFLEDEGYNARPNQVRGPWIFTFTN